MSLSITLFLTIFLINILVPVESLKTTLKAGEILTSEDLDMLESPDAKTHLMLQKDGNLVMFQGGKSIWASDTEGEKDDYYLKLEPQGALRIYNSKNEYYRDVVHFLGESGDWRLHTNNNGVLYLTNPDGILRWTSLGHVYGTSIASGTVIPSPFGIVSPDWNTFMAMRDDGQLVIYKGHETIGGFSHATGEGRNLRFTDTGALQLANHHGEVLHTMFEGASTKGTYTAWVTNDGKISVKEKNGRELWSSSPN